MKNILLQFCMSAPLLFGNVCYAQANYIENKIITPMHQNVKAFEDSEESNISSLTVVLVNTEKEFARNISTDSLAHFISNIFLSINNNIGKSNTDNSFIMEIIISKNNPTYRMAYKNKLNKIDTQYVNDMMKEIKTIKKVTTKETLKFNIIFSVEAKKPNFI